MNPVLVISDRDNVGTALEALAPGQIVKAGDATVRIVEAVPRGHKVALADIRSGGAVVKYGNSIGVASASIAAGSHVHTHNVASARGRGDLGRYAPPSEARIAEPPDRDEPDQVEIAEPAPKEPHRA